MNTGGTAGVLLSSTVLHEWYNLSLLFTAFFFLKSSGKLSQTKPSVSNPIKQCYWGSDKTINIQRENMKENPFHIIMGERGAKGCMRRKCVLDEQLGSDRFRLIWGREMIDTAGQALSQSSVSWKRRTSETAIWRSTWHIIKKNQTQNSSLQGLVLPDKALIWRANHVFVVEKLEALFSPKPEHA